MGYATNRGEMKPKPPKNFGFYLQVGGVIYYLCIQIAQGTSQYFSKTYHPFFLCYLKNMKNTARKTSINNMTSINNITSINSMTSINNMTSQ